MINIYSEEEFKKSFSFNSKIISNDFCEFSTTIEIQSKFGDYQIVKYIVTDQLNLYNIFLMNISLFSSLYKIKLENFIQIYNFYSFKLPTKEFAIAISMEKADMNLQKMINNLKINLSEEKIIKYFKSLIKTMCFLYRNNFFHKNINTHNLLIKDDELIIGDNFTSTKSMQINDKFPEEFLFADSNIEYMAPEVLKIYKSKSIKNEDINWEKNDVYSCGLCFAKLINLDKKYENNFDSIKVF